MFYGQLENREFEGGLIEMGGLRERGGAYLI